MRTKGDRLTRRKLLKGAGGVLAAAAAPPSLTASVSPPSPSATARQAAAAGTVIGLAGSLAVTRGLETLLYEMPARDPLVLASTSVLLMLVSTLAGYLPARRAMLENPASVLRGD